MVAVVVAHPAQQLPLAEHTSSDAECNLPSQSFIYPNTGSQQTTALSSVCFAFPASSDLLSFCTTSLFELLLLLLLLTRPSPAIRAPSHLDQLDHDDAVCPRTGPCLIGTPPPPPPPTSSSHIPTLHRQLD